MKGRALDIFRQRVFLGNTLLSHDAGNRRGFAEALLPHQKVQRPITAATCRNLEHAGFHAGFIPDWPDAEPLQQAAAGNVLGQFLNRDAGFHAPDICLTEHKLVERDVARRRQGYLFGNSSHRCYSATGSRKPLSRPPTRHKAQRRPLTLEDDAAAREKEDAKRTELETGASPGFQNVRPPCRTASSPAPPDQAGHPDGSCREPPP